LQGALLTEVHDRLNRVGHQPAGRDAASVVAALTDWGGIENLEERIDGSHTVDRVVLAMLRQKAGAAE